MRYSLPAGQAPKCTRRIIAPPQIGSAPPPVSAATWITQQAVSNRLANARPTLPQLGRAWVASASGPSYGRRVQSRERRNAEVRAAVGRILLSYVVFALLFLATTEALFEISDGENAERSLAIRLLFIALSGAVLAPVMWHELRGRQAAEGRLDEHTASTAAARERRLEMLHRLGQHLSPVLGDAFEARIRTARALAPEFFDLADIVLASTADVTDHYEGQPARLLQTGFESERVLAELRRTHGGTIRSAAVVPVMAGETLIAVLVVANCIGREPITLTESDLEALQQASVRLGTTLERIRLHQEVSRSERLESLGRLAGGVAHDFNNLLTVILGYSDIVLRRLPEDSQDRADLEAVRRAGEQARDLTDQLLTVSKRRVVQAEPVDPNDVVESIGQVLRRLVGTDIDLLTVTNEVERVMIDRAQLEQVLLNLVVNARDAMPDGGRLTLSTEAAAMPSGGRAATVICVSDTGVGMDEDTLAHCFEPFFTTKSGHDGTGLGLATVYGVVSQAGGEVVIDSAPGRGTTFRVHLPALAPTTGEPEAVETGPARILLVDDEADVRGLTRRRLEAEGFTVIEAGSGAEALALLGDGGEVDLLLTDVVMPGMTGPELARRVDERLPGLPVLYISGFAEDPAIQDADVADLRFLAKPFEAHQLRAAVQGALAAASR